jgi:apolipoprotein D and lipocalin family protein
MGTETIANNRQFIHGDPVVTHKILSLIFGVATIVTGCTSIPEGLQPVTGFEPDRYLGKWYEIARLDHSFERDLSNVSATYTRGENDDIRVKNRGFNTKTGAWKQIEGHARFLEGDTVGSLKVSFFGPFYGGYHIIALDRQDYRYAMVTGPSRSYLWILARNKTLEESIYAELVSRADAWSFDTKQLIRVEHNLPDEEMRLPEHSIKPDAKENIKMITSCPSTPNCVSSVDKGRKHFIEPLRFVGSAKDAQYRLLNILSELKLARVVTVEDNFIGAEFTSFVFRFIDDVEFYYDDPHKIIHVKSASRVGYSDLGANRRRVEKIRKLFNRKE